MCFPLNPANLLPASLTSPLANATMNAPGSFTLTAAAASTSSTVSKVEFFADSILINTVTNAPYTYQWNNVATGTHNLIAVVTDALGNTAISTTVMVTVNSGVVQAYYIHTDHLDTPRKITDVAGNVVWEWQNTDPFGNNPPNENPTGLGAFPNNLGFAGQYRDRETNTFYNTYRDAYDSESGRYTQSDPIGLAGGSWSTYSYVDGSPLMFVDPDGLAPNMRNYSGGNSAQNRYVRRHQQPNIPRMPSNDNASDAAGYYDDEGEFVCLKWSCPSNQNQCSKGDTRSPNDFLPAATDPNNSPKGCTCDAPRFRARGTPGTKGADDYIDATVRGYKRFHR